MENNIKKSASRKVSSGKSTPQREKKKSSGSTPKASSNDGVCATEDKNVSIRKRTTKMRSSYSCAVKTEEEKEFPMFIAMADLVITPTGFSEPKQREAICSKIQLMCGEISMAYTSKTTHILAAHANTSKVELARQRELPVVTIDWVENIWNACQQNNPYTHASLPQFKHFEFPLFYNLYFVFSWQYDFDNKQYYENLVTMHGGLIVSALKKTSDCFYICQEAESGRLYTYAQSKQIPCLPLAWIIESINRNTLAVIGEYQVRGKPNSAELGLTFDMGDQDCRETMSISCSSLPSFSSFSANLRAQVHQHSYQLYPTGSYISTANSTNSTTLVAEYDFEENDYGMEENTSALEESSSSLDQTVVDPDQLMKDELMDSLTFTLAA